MDVDLQCVRSQAMRWAQAQAKRLETEGIKVSEGGFGVLLREGWRRAKESPSCAISPEAAQAEKAAIERLLESGDSDVTRV